MSGNGAEQVWRDASLPVAERVAALLAAMTVDEKLGQLNHRNDGVPRLGIPPYVWWNEALHGLARAGAATVFPQAIGMAATFAPETVRGMGDVIALEGRARHHASAAKGDYGTYKGLTYFSPNVNIFRDPRWGRGHETYGEDPYLTGLMGAAFVRGVQGDDPTHLKAVATPKHYAVHSGPEATRLSFDSVADERDLRETYLPAFKACFAAGAKSVMTAYNAYNGTACTLNTYLIEDILRGEWGADIVVVTDAGAGEALYKEHKVVADYPEATARELACGVDVIVDWEQGVREAYARGLIADELIDRALTRQYTLKFQLGMFDDPATVPLADTPYEIIECDVHRADAREATRRSLVLLKNTGGLLPLRKESLTNIAVIGPNADSREVLMGNYFGTPTRHTTLLAGIQKAAPAGCRVWYAKGCEHIGPRTEFCAEDHDRFAEAEIIAERADVAILCIGLSPTIEGEAGDAFNAEASGDRRTIELPAIQELLVQKIVATGTPVVVLMVSGSAIISQRIEADVPAMLQCWYPGAEGGDVIADMLFGGSSPAGRLPVTFYRSTDDLPPFTSYDMTNRTYRFFNGEAAYPFGFGLSYTSFHYSDLQLTRNAGGIDVSVTVENTGDVDSDEVVQVYVSMTRDGHRTPLRSLAAVQRLHIPAGARQKVALRVFDDQLLVTAADGTQALIPGPCHLSVGGSQPDPRSIALMGTAPLAGTVQI